MPPLKRLVLFVEGDGDAEAVPILVNRLLGEQNAADCLFLDGNIFRVDSITNLIGRRENNWLRFLGAAQKRGHLGGVLLLLDGDIKLKKGELFCPVEHALDLSRRARKAGAGARFSVASVFACQEYETWFIASMEALAGKLLPPDDRPGVREKHDDPGADLEQRFRNAKGWLSKQMQSGYKPTTDQEALTRLMVQDLGIIRQRQLRSFRRLEKAVQELVLAIRTDVHIVTPELPPPATESKTKK